MAAGNDVARRADEPKANEMIDPAAALVRGQSC